MIRVRAPGTRVGGVSGPSRFVKPRAARARGSCRRRRAGRALSIARASTRASGSSAGRYDVAWDRGLLSRARYLAGDDDRRRRRARGGSRRPRIRGVVAARGGYGSMRILSRVWPIAGGAPVEPRSRQAARRILGHHGAPRGSCRPRGRVSIHGPVVTQLATQPSTVVERFFVDPGGWHGAAPRRSAARRSSGASPRARSSGGISPFSRVFSARRGCRISPARCCCSRTSGSGRTGSTACGPISGWPGSSSAWRAGTRRLHRLRGAGRGVHAPRRAREPGRRDRASVRRRAPDRPRRGQRAGRPRARVRDSTAAPARCRSWSLPSRTDQAAASRSVA